MMESSSDVVGVKEEPNDNWLDVEDGSIFDPLDFCTVENFKTLPFLTLSANHEDAAMALQESSREKIIKDSECEDVKPELKFFPTSINKLESQHFQSIVKIENENRTIDRNGKKMIILIKKGFDYDNNCQLNVNSRFTIAKCNNRKSLDATVTGKSSRESKMYSKTEKASPKKHTNTTEDYNESFFCRSDLEIHSKMQGDYKKLFECEICHSLFSCKDYHNNHISVVHDCKSFECEICHKSFLHKSNLNKHKIHVHNRIKPFQCEICNKSFGYKSHLNQHINAIHNHIKLFDCKICRKSFGYWNTLKIHVNTVHNRIKPFQCKICYKSFEYKGQLTVHLRAIHINNKPFECQICHKLFEQKISLESHINAMHNHKKPFGCEICHKSFGYQNILKIHMNVIHRRNKF